jgi:glycosyltransferase 2 family protein
VRERACEGGDDGGCRRLRGRLLRAGMVLLFAAAAVTIGLRVLSIQDFLVTIETFDHAYLVPIFALALAYYLLKAIRWHYYLRQADVPVTVWRSGAAYFAGQWFTFTPAGELMRAGLLGEGAEFARVVPTIVAQGIADFLSLALVATAVVPLYPALAPVVLPVTVPILLTAGALALPPLRRHLAGWRFVKLAALGKRRMMLEQAAYLLGPRPMAVGLVLSLPSVALGGLTLYCAGRAIALPVWPLASAEGVYALIQLLGGLSPLPQGLGVTEGSGTFILGYLGVEPTDAFAAVLLFRVATLGLSVVLGLLAFVALRHTASPAQTAEEEEKT